MSDQTMNEQSDVLYVSDMARKLGRTERAVRAGIHKKVNAGKTVEWLPTPFKLGEQWAWLRSDVDEWLAKKAQEAEA